MSDTSVNFNVPKDAKGVLKWLFIDGEGKKDLNDKLKYSAQVVLTPTEAAPYIEEVEAFWEENRPSSWKFTKKDTLKDKKIKIGDPKEPHSLGFKEDDDGNFVFNFKTNPKYADGTQKVIDIHNARANKISLGGKKIGNGSIGALGGIMDIYEGGGNCGVTFYLNAVQLRKFIEFSPDAGFEASEEEGDFEGIDSSMDGFEAQSDDNDTPQPRL